MKRPFGIVLTQRVSFVLRGNKMINQKRSGSGFSFRNLIHGDWFEFLFELGAIAIGFAIVCIFPTGIFEKWPDLAILLGAAIIIGILGIVWLIRYLIRRKNN